MRLTDAKMKTILFSRADNCRSADEPQRLFAAIERHGFDWSVNREFAASIERLTGRTIPEDKIYDERTGTQPEGSVMICYGGDGTLLEGVHRLDGEPVPVIGINSGHLGFLATASKENIDETFELISRNELTVEERSMLAIDGVVENQTLYALNEVAVQRFGATMLSVGISIDGRSIATCDGSGVIISTPTGSTAYSLSAGGPIVEPSCKCLAISPLAPHNLTMRPTVVPDSSRITLEIDPRHRPLTISFDHRTCDIDKKCTITIKRAERSVFLAVPHNNSFYDTLRNKMMWGIDIRK